MLDRIGRVRGPGQGSFAQLHALRRREEVLHVQRVLRRHSRLRVTRVPAAYGRRQGNVETDGVSTLGLSFERLAHGGYGIASITGFARAATTPKPVSFK